MPWLRMDDQFADNTKVVPLSNSAFRLHVQAMCYASSQLTDGFIPVAVLPRLGWTSEDVEDDVRQLAEQGLWETVDGGYTIHDFLEYNPSREEVMATREIIKRRQAMNDDPELARAVKGRDGDRCRYCGVTVNWKDRKSEGGGTYDHVMPITQGGNESPGNIVVCCRRCNTRKGARTPEQAGMPLLDPPDSPLSSTESRRNLDGTKPVIQTSPSPSPSPIKDPTTTAAGPESPSDEANGQTAALYALIERSGVIVAGALQAQEWDSLLDITQDMGLVSEAFQDCAAQAKLPSPKYIRAILERCLTDGTRPGVKHRDAGRAPPGHGKPRARLSAIDKVLGAK